MSDTNSLQKKKLFISHSHKDNEFVLKLTKELEKSGFLVWIDDHLEGGVEFPEKIRNELLNSDYILILLSEHSINSKWVKREIAFSDSQNKALVPIMIGQFDMAKIPLELAGRQVTRFLEEEEGFQIGVARLLNALGINFVKASVEYKQSKYIVQSVSTWMADIVSFLDRAINTLRTYLPISSTALELKLVEAFVSSTNSETGFIVELNNGQWEMNKDSTIPIIFSRRHEIISIIGEVLDKTSGEGMGKPPIFRHMEFRSGTGITFMQLDEECKKYLILVNVGSRRLTDAACIIIRALYNRAVEITGHGEFGRDQLRSMEGFALDVLRIEVGLTPNYVHDRRLGIFASEIEDITFFFQPTFHLFADNPFISSWEALARDKRSGLFPKSIFHAAEIWGSSFIGLIDKYTLRNATALYKKLWRSTSTLNFEHNQKDLSVNVFIETLFDNDYFDILREITTDIIRPENLILEISEKTPLSSSPNIKVRTFGFEDLRERMVKIVRDLNVRFAIDDFGAGYANLTRLYNIPPSVVKIDREILLTKRADSLERSIQNFIDFIKLIVTDEKQAPIIVFEGYDDVIAEKLPLYKLHKLGVRYIQGNYLGAPTQQLKQLDEELALRLKHELTSPPGKIVLPFN